jgi:hypothetical protein
MASMIPIVWLEYRFSKSGSLHKFVECEKCKTTFVYLMQREVHGRGASVYFLDNEGAANRAREEAEVGIWNVLLDDCDPVPCIHCGIYQEQMIRKMKFDREQKRDWLPWVVLLLPFATALLAFIAWRNYGNAAQPQAFRAWAVVSLAVAIAWIVSAVSQYRISSFDPNSAPVEDRMARGRQCAVTLAEFEELSKQHETSKP